MTIVKTPLNSLKWLQNSIKLTCLIFALVASSKIQAQTSGPLFLGAFQYLDGNLELTKRNKQTIEPDFKDLILIGEELRTKTESLAKIITRSRCKIVVYQNSLIRGLKKKDSTYGFRLKRGAMRVICDDNSIAKQLIRVDKSDFIMEKGEFLFADGKLFVLSGSVQSNKQILTPLKIYSLKDNLWTIAADPNDKKVAFEFNQQYPSPKEGLKLEDPTPPPPVQPDPQQTADEKPKSESPKLVSSRWTANIGIGNSNIGYAAGAETSDVDASAFRLAANFKMWDISFIAFIERFEIETSSNNQDPTGVSGGFEEENEVMSFGLGIRYNHQRWWSFYTNLGIGSHEMYVEQRNPFFGGNIRQTAIHVQLGIESHLTPPLEWLQWTGLYLGFEVFLLQGIATDGEPFDEITFPSQDFIDREGTWRNFGFKIMLGTYLQFFED